MAELLFSSEDSKKAGKALARLAEATRLEPGCIRYEAAQDVGEPGRFHLSELWEDLGALTRHFDTPHMAAFSAEARSLGYSAPYIKRIEVAGIADFKPSDLKQAR